MTKRSSFNVSLQKKHNKVVLGPLIERSEHEGGVISDMIVDYVEKALDYEKVMGLNKVMQTYKLIQNMVAAQHPYGSAEYNQAIEEVLKRVIRIDGAELSVFLSDPMGYTGGEASPPLSSMPAIAPQVTSRVVEAKKQETPSLQHETTKVNGSPAPDASHSDMDESDEEEREAERLRKERAEARRKRKEEQEALLKKQEDEKEEDESDDDEVDFDIANLNTGALFND